MLIAAAVLVMGAVWIGLGSRVRERLAVLLPSLRTGPAVPPSETTPLISPALQAPMVAELLAAALSAGAPMSIALKVTVDATDDPSQSILRRVLVALELGADPTVAWAEVLDQPALEPIASAVIRSHHSGAPLTDVLETAAADARHAHRAEVEMRARSAGVRAVAPLALCYLPAYLLVGVVPIIAGFAGSVLN